MRTCPQCSESCDSSHKFCPACGFPLAKVQVKTDDPLIGQNLPGGFVILDLVGIGGMGRVYRAEQTNLGRTVAVKIIHPHLVGEENAAARFITEARAASRLNHPNSVAVIDFGKTDDGQLYLVMEFLRGKDLARIVYEDGLLSFKRSVDVLRQVLAALAEAHHQQIIHRDLKPENIILEPLRGGGDFVKVVDFGLAKMREGSTQPNITSPGIVCGTPEYMSPEQGRGDPLDPRSDLYAVGVIMYQLLTGRLPFEGESPTQVVLMHIGEPPPEPNSIAPGRNIPQSLVDVCLMALAKETKHRFNDADEFSAALADAIAEVEPPPRRAMPSMINCPACGAPNTITQKFCGECGTPMMGRPSTMPQSMLPAEAPSRVPPEGTERAGQARGNRQSLPLPLMGRDDDLQWLIERRRAAELNFVGARLVGEHGMGKSRLLREFFQEARAAGDRVVQVGPDPAWAEVGYFALRRAITELAGIDDAAHLLAGPTDANRDAHRGLLEVFELERFPRATPDERRHAAAEALRWALIRSMRRTQTGITVLVIDDLGNCDGASQLAFADAVGDAPSIPALVVGSYTPGLDPGWPGSATARVLTGLSIEQVGQMMIPGMPLEGIADSFTRGVPPLYLEQVVRFSREQGGQAPTRLADVIASRVERLAPNARRILQSIAVWGDDTTENHVAKILKARGDDDAAITLLERAGMIQRSGPKSWAAAHPLIRDVVIATIPAAVRRELHSNAAELGESLGSPLEARAVHEFYAQNAFQALILLEQVSNRCTQRGDTHGTIIALRRGAELARRDLNRGDLDDPLRALLIFTRKLGEALSQAGQFTDAEGLLREALDLAGPSGEDRARVLGALARVSKSRDRMTEAKNYLTEAMLLASESGTGELMSSLEEIQRTI